MTSELQDWYDGWERDVGRSPNLLVQASGLRHIPNSIGWPTEEQGYSLDITTFGDLDNEYDLNPSPTHGEKGLAALIFDGEQVAVWTGGRWFAEGEIHRWWASAVVQEATEQAHRGGR